MDDDTRRWRRIVYVPTPRPEDRWWLRWVIDQREFPVSGWVVMHEHAPSRRPARSAWSGPRVALAPGKMWVGRFFHEENSPRSVVVKATLCTDRQTSQRNLESAEEDLPGQVAVVPEERSVRFQTSTRS